MTQYKVGERLRSQVSSAQLVVIRAQGELEIACDGVPLARAGDELASGGTSAGAPIEVGKRYEDPEEAVELLCVAAGTGELSVNGVPLQLKVPKPLPASD